VLKRKRDPSPVPDQAALADQDSEHAIAAKRRRQRAIENGLASLSLDGGVPTPTTPVSPYLVLPTVAAPREKPSQTPLSRISLNPAPDPELPEIQMKSSSWYEPEKDRIVVLDLDFDDESASDGGSQHEEDDAGLRVSSALLARLKNVTPKNDLPKPVDDTSKALVLFTPSPWTAATPSTSKPPPAPSSPPSTTEGRDAGDDVIMMDIDS